MPKDRHPKPDAHSGSFRIEYRDGFATLTVLPLSANSRPLYDEDVINRMRLLGITGIDSEKVHTTIEEAAGKPVPISPWPQGAQLSAKLDISVAEDLMSVVVFMHRPKKGGGILQKQDIIDLLVKEGVLFGVKQEKIQEMVSEELYDTNIIVAEGKQRKDGKPARTEFFFNTTPGKPYMEMSGGRINLKELSFVQDKKKGEILARIHPEEAPQDGYNVRGESLVGLPPGEAVIAQAGVNTEYSEDRKAILSAIDGNVFIKDNAICVEPIVVVERVDYSTGNLHFHGSVIIKKEVADGFLVEAKGSIEIGEFVGRAELKAGRDVLLKGGLNGDHHGSVRCGGDMIAKYVENARISCGGNLIIEELIMHTDLVVTENLVLKGKRAELIGGNAVVGKVLWCKQVGSISEVPTRISVGVSPDLLSQYINKKMTFEEKNQRLQHLRAEIKHLENLDSHTKETKEKAEVALDQIRDEADLLTLEIPKLNEELRETRKLIVPNKGSYAVVEGTMYPNAIIAFGHVEYHATGNGTEKTIFKFKADKIEESGFNAKEPPPSPLSEKKD